MSAHIGAGNVHGKPDDDRSQASLVPVDLTQTITPSFAKTISTPRVHVCGKTTPSSTDSLAERRKFIVFRHMRNSAFLDGVGGPACRWTETGSSADRVSRTIASTWATKAVSEPVPGSRRWRATKSVFGV